ncbi:MAG: hypothetical protein HUU57_15685 [Bdellovibrio sp.]|nr:hypothetical protein [Bdellovibrio sp.]
MAKSYLEEARDTAITLAVKRLKEEFRKWYAALSLKEIVTNKVLIEEIEVLEKMLSERKVSL